MHAGNLDEDSLEMKSHINRGMNLFSIDRGQPIVGKPKVRGLPPEKKSREAIWVIAILMLFCSPLLFPFFSPVSEVNDSFEEDHEWKPQDAYRSKVLPDNSLSFSAKESLKSKRPNIIGSRGFIGTSYPIGDWYIDGVAMVWNETIDLKGNLIVNETGILYLMNVTLIINCSSDGQYRIEVTNGGELYIGDNDDDRFTEVDASEITAYNSSYKYMFHVKKGSRFEMKNSKMSWCGYDWGASAEYSGLWINTNNTVMTGNHIKKMRNGIVFFESNYNIVANNTIEDNYFNGLYIRASTNNIIYNNSIHSNDLSGIYIEISADNNTISNNEIINNVGHGIRVWGSDSNRIEYNNITANALIGVLLLQSSNINQLLNNNVSENTGYGVYLEYSSSNQIINNSILSNRYHGLGLVDQCSKNNITSNKIISNWENGILISQQGNENIIRNNEISKNREIGLHLSSSSKNHLMGNTLSFNFDNGIALYNSANDNNIYNNIIINNTYLGLRISSSSRNKFIGNDLINNTNRGIYISTSSYNVFDKCNFYGNTFGGIHISDSSIENLLVNSSLQTQVGDEISISTSSRLIILNSSFNKDKINVMDTTSVITVQWYLHIKVTEYNGYPLSWSKIRIRDNENGSFDKNFFTNQNGTVKWIILTEYNLFSSNDIYFTPHNITATYYGDLVYEKTVMPEPMINKTMTITIVFGIPYYNSIEYIYLYPGWNLISFPYIQSNHSIDFILQSLQGYYNAVQWYNSTDLNDHWKHSHNLKPTNLNDLTKLDNKKGFWIHITHSEKVIFRFNGTVPIEDQTISLKKGWNLVGYPSPANRHLNKALNNLQFGVDINVIQCYNSETKSWETLGVNDHISRGKGYWVHAMSDMIWIVNSTKPPVFNINKNLHYDSIQEGLNDARDNNIIFVSEGVFNESIMINKSVYLRGDSENLPLINGNLSIISDNSSISNLDIRNTSKGIILDGVKNIDISNVIINNCTSGIEIMKSLNISLINSLLQDCVYGVSSVNSVDINIINSKIDNFTQIDFQLDNSTVAVLNSSFDPFDVKLINNNSFLIVQWFLKVITEDQLGFLIYNSQIHIMDNDNGTFNETYHTKPHGSTDSIIITERIQNITGNISFTPHTISALHPDFTFIDEFYVVFINKSMKLIFTSLNTVFESNVYNLNKNRYYLTIQEANDDADPYDTIQVSRGTYYENLNINRPLDIQGEGKGSTVIDGKGDFCFNITSDDVVISNIGILNSSYGLYSQLNGSISFYNSKISNSTFGIYINQSSIIFEGCILENNTNGIVGLNSDNVDIFNTSLNNDIFELSLTNCSFTTLNCKYDDLKIYFGDSTSLLTVKWYLHVQVEDATNYPITGANVWIRDNDNGSYDMNFTTGSDGYVWYIVLTERIQNQSGNISYNPYSINVSYYDSRYVNGWLTFPNNPRNITLNGSLFEIRKETFTSLESIPEFSHILIPIMAICASFIVFRKDKKNVKKH